MDWKTESYQVGLDKGNGLNEMKNTGLDWPCTIGHGQNGLIRNGLVLHKLDMDRTDRHLEYWKYFQMDGTKELD